MNVTVISPIIVYKNIFQKSIEIGPVRTGYWMLVGAKRRPREKREWKNSISYRNLEIRQLVRELLGECGIFIFWSQRRKLYCLAPWMIRRICTVLFLTT